MLRHGATVPIMKDMNNEMSLEFLASLLAIDSNDPAHKITPKSVQEHINTLNHDLKDIKKHGDPTIEQMQEMGNRITWIHRAADKRLAQLHHEERSLAASMDRAWAKFDMLLQPIWRIDAEMVPIHQELATILTQLETIKNAPYSELSSDERSKRLHALQDELHELEQSNRIEDARMYPLGTQKEKIERGQAMTFTLIHRCYKLVHQLVQVEPDGMILLSKSMNP